MKNIEKNSKKRINPLLKIAVEHNILWLVRILIFLRVNVNADDGFALSTATLLEYYDLAVLLIKAGADPSLDDNKALVIASNSSNELFMRLLIENGADPNTNEADILRRGIKFNGASFVEFLLKHGANPNKDALEILLTAMECHNISTFELLVNKGADIHVCNDIIFAEAIKEAKPEFVEFLISKGVKPTCRDNCWIYIITKDYYEHSHEYSGDDIRRRRQILEYLFNSGVNPTDNGNFALKEIVRFNCIEFVDIFLEYGVNPRAEHDIALYTAIEYGYEEMAMILINAISDYTDLAKLLVFCVDKDQIEIAEMLISKGADIHYNDDEALYYAVKEENNLLVHFLLEKGANPTARNNLLLAMAVKENNGFITKALIEYGADVNVPYGYNVSAAIVNENKFILEYLIKNGADVSVANNFPLIKANYNCKQIIDLLKKAGVEV